MVTKHVHLLSHNFQYNPKFQQKYSSGPIQQLFI